MYNGNGIGMRKDLSEASTAQTILLPEILRAYHDKDCNVSRVLSRTSEEVVLRHPLTAAPVKLTLEHFVTGQELSGRDALLLMGRDYLAGQRGLQQDASFSFSGLSVETQPPPLSAHYRGLQFDARYFRVRPDGLLVREAGSNGHNVKWIQLSFYEFLTAIGNLNLLPATIRSAANHSQAQ